MKKRFVWLALASLVVTLAWFALAFRPAQSRLGDLRADVDTTKQQVAELEARLERLLDLERAEPEVRAEAARMASALPADDPKVSDVIIQIQDAANAAGIDFLTITPSLPATPAEAAAAAPAPAPAADGTVAPAAVDPVGRLRSIDVQIKADGQFFAIEDFVLRLESLARALRIDDFSLTVGSQDGGGTALSSAIKLRIFMLVPQAAAGTAPATGTAQDTSGAA